MQSSTLILLSALTVGLAACGSPDGDAGVAATPSESALEIDADLVVPTAEESVRLADHRGEVMVLQIAEASDTEAWAALDDAHPDLAAEGATVMGIVIDGHREADPGSLYPVRHAEDRGWADALGYDGSAMAVVIGPAGRLRGRSFKADGDAIVALAAPVLLEADLGPTDAPTARALTPESVESLVRSGAALIDVRTSGEPLAHAVAIPLALLRADVLPADPGTPIVFVGPDAERAMARATGWGFVAVYALLDDRGLEVVSPDEVLPAYDPRDDLPRVRG